MEELNRPDRVELVLPMVSLFPEEVRESLTSIFGEERIGGLNHEQWLALSVCHTEDTISNSRLQDVLEMHRADITTLLKGLCADGFLMSLGTGRGTVYRINKEYGNVASNVASSVASNVASNDANAAATSRLSYEAMVALICSVATDFLSLEDIAAAIHKNARYLNNRIIPRMVSEQLLERLYPDNPRHPNQKYKAKK